jgi:hypothetical protein
MSTHLLLAGIGNLVPGLAIGCLNLIVALALAAVSLLLVIAVSSVACFYEGPGELQPIRCRAERTLRE